MRRRSGWRSAFPLPLVAIAVLLLLLIAITPDLVTVGRPPAGSLEASPELLVDRAPGLNVTHFYVRGIDNVRYAWITLSLDPNPSWPPSSPSGLRFPNATVWNQTLGAADSSGRSPVALNVSVLYIDATGAEARYIGIFEFNVTADAIAWQALYPSQGSLTSTPLPSLPLSIPLEIGSYGAGH